MGMTRTELWGELGTTLVEPLLLSIYEKEEIDNWKQGDKAPHGQPWFTSFHASAFPGDEDSVCGRAQVYELMNPAPEKPLEPWLRAMFEVGSDHEHKWVKRFFDAGVLLTANVAGEDQFQTGFEEPSIWLTGSPDAIILPPFHRKCHVVEVKTTSHEKVMTMQAEPENVPYSHKKYVRQLKTYIGLAFEKPFDPRVSICRISGSQIRDIGMSTMERSCFQHNGPCDPVMLRVQPPTDGTLIYSSREEPLKVASYYVSYDPDFLKAGREKVAQWRKEFEEDKIPPHVREGFSAKWSEGECTFCNHKKPYCKIDYKNKTTTLSKSQLIKHTKSVRPGYDPVATRQVVLDRWGVTDE